MAFELNLASLPRAEQLAASRLHRRLTGRWRRVVRWEFWPPYVFYPPVLAYLAYLGIRFRSFTLFTAANPAIPAGGFIGESKYEILQQLKGAGSALPHSVLLPEGERVRRIEQALAFMQAHRLDFPVVLKPDAGQRGSGVAVVRSGHQLREYLAQVPIPVIVQEYVPGLEFGVFYCRYPDDPSGRIFSVTEKRMPVLVGDGRRTLEELILSDERAVCMAEFYKSRNRERLHQVVPAGERVQLVEIGTHCRGAIFLDGSYAITPALEKEIDRIARRFNGFFFGRFDVRVPSVADLMAGRNLKVLELNGVTSEATHIYDPKMSLASAYRVLFKQWRMAFEIGKQNCARGAKPGSLRQLAGMIREYQRLANEHPA